MDISIARGRNAARIVLRTLRDGLVPVKRQAPIIPAEARDWATDSEEPTLANPVSQLCTQNQFEEPAFASWCVQMKEQPQFRRKLWEFVYILEVLEQAGMLAPGRHGLGFGTGQEPLPAVMAARGAQVLATDLDSRRASDRGWVQSHQHAAALADLNSRGICDPEAFERLVRFEFADMNKLSPAYAGRFDFCWSACALEHLGSIEAGLAFIENSVRCLKPGGVAVHTTEYNCYSDRRTVDNEWTVLFRMRDFIALGAALRERGHDVRFNFNTGSGELDRHIDVAPYSMEKHLKLELMRYVSTSIGIIIRT